MSNSVLVDYVALSPNHSGKRTSKITKLAIHHVAGVLSVETIGRIFSGTSRSASSNYGIGYDGRVGMYVDEANRSWCTSSNWVDQQAVTIETSNSGTGGDWPISNHVFAKLVELCVDICKRNGIKRVTYTGDKDGTLVMHCWFAATACPGPALKAKFKQLEQLINARLAASEAVVAPKPVTAMTYTVVPGDSLSKISEKHKDMELSWRTIAEYNGITEPWLIKPGQILRLTRPADYEVAAPIQDRKTYIVKSKDTLTNIAAAYGTTWQALARLNGLADPSKIFPGQVLSLPLAVAATNTSTAIKVGDLVKVKQGATSYEGAALAGFVYRTIYTVLELKGMRAVIGLGGQVTTSMDVRNLIKQ